VIGTPDPASAPRILPKRGLTALYAGRTPIWQNAFHALPHASCCYHIGCEDYGGLTDDQLRRQAVPPSNLSLLGLVRHMAEVERNWFRPVLGEPFSGLWVTDRLDFEASFRDVATADAGEAFRQWDAECAHARVLTAAAPSLDVTGDRDGHGTFSLRWILAHMIEEYARHNGHADLLRERIDGATGD
jgi:hypothetical protein